MLLLDRPKATLDLGEARVVLLDPGSDLRAAQREHRPQLVGGHIGVEDRPGLGEGEAEVLERDESVEPAELVGGVAPVAAARIDGCGHEQPSAS